MGIGVGVSDGTGVKKTVGRGVRVDLGGRVVDVGSGVRVASGVHVAGAGSGVSVMARVGLGVGVLSSATAVGSDWLPKGAKPGEMKITVW